MADWESWVGKRTVCEALLSAEPANMLAATLGREREFEIGDEMPLAYQWLYFNDVISANRLGRDGHPQKGITLPPIDLPRRMWAAGSFELHRPLVFGSHVERISTIESIVPKEGRSGSLCFVTILHEYANEGTIALSEKQTIVYREEATDSTAVARVPAPTGASQSEKWQLNEVALFRYSALTFNGHRIHYDVDYARNIEGYPGLVIHGPLEATLLCELMRANGVVPRTFAYQAKSPVCLPEAFVTNVSSTADGHELWVSGEDGGLLMSAKAS
ncbi:MAG: acyl-CoA dehydrogenase [Leucobacter sp.]|nr:acyl-CoA dehydrogenase [Leucobacter sp.]